MNYRVFIITASLTLSSCLPVVTAMPTLLPTSSPIASTQTATPTSQPTPSPTLLLIDPFRIPTPINTPHPVPTALSRNSAYDLGVLRDGRVDGFKDTLSFKITIAGVGFEMQGTDRYIVDVEGILTNISNSPIVVRRMLSSGHTLNEDVNWNISYNGRTLDPSICCYDAFPNLSANDFVVLQPNEFQKYVLSFPLPLELPDEKGEKISLSNKKIELTAEYLGFNVGYLDTKTEPSTYVDMNAWVGLVESNSVEYKFP